MHKSEMIWEAWLWLGINYLVLTPIGLHFTVKFWEKFKRGDNIIALRRPKLVLCILFASLYYICFHQTIYILLLGFIASSNDNYKFEFLFDSIGYQTIFILYFWRSWHIYFDQICNRLKADDKWKKIIDEKYDETHRIHFENKLFIKYENSLGNQFFTFKWFIIPYILLYILIVVISLYTNTNNNNNDGLMIAEYFAIIYIFIIIISFIYLFYNHISSVYDTIYLRNEILIQSIVILVALIIEIIIVFTINQSSMKNDDEIVHIELLLESIIPSIAFFINILMATFYVFYKQIQEQRDYQRYKDQIRVSDSETPPIDNNGGHRNSYINPGHVELFKLLRSKEGLKIFVDHCVREFATENLYCIIEICQYKDYCIQQMLRVFVYVTLNINNNNQLRKTAKNKIYIEQEMRRASLRKRGNI